MTAPNLPGRSGATDPAREAVGRPARLALAAAAGATAVGVVAWLMQAILGRVVPGAPYETWGGVFRLVEGELFFVLVGIAYATAHRWPVEGRRHWRRVAAQLALGLVLAFAHGAIMHALAPTLRPWWFAKRGGEIVGSTAKDAMFAYALASGLAYGVVRWRTQRARQVAALDARRRATAAQLALLALDLQPQAVLHTMDVLAELIPGDPAAANEGLVVLATSLGATLDAMRAGGLTLEAELAHVQAIVRLHAITTGQYADCSAAIGGAEHAVVPPQLLPGAVGAVLSAATGLGPGTIAVAAVRDGSELALALRVEGDEPPPAVVAWAARQPPALARVAVEPGSGAAAGDTQHWALHLRVPWREMTTGEASEASRPLAA